MPPRVGPLTQRPGLPLDIFHAADLGHQVFVDVLDEGLAEREPDLIELAGAALLARVVQREIR